MENNLTDKIFFSCAALLLSSGLAYSIITNPHPNPVLGKSPPRQYRNYDFNKNGILDKNEMEAISRDKVEEEKERERQLITYFILFGS